MTRMAGLAEGGKGSWLRRAATKVASVASDVSAKTAAVLDFHSGAADVIVIKHTLATGGVELRSTNWGLKEVHT